MKYKCLSLVFVLSLFYSTSTYSIILEGICLELLKVLSGHLFKNYLNERHAITLRGAPNWYYKEWDDDHLCAFSTQAGDLDVVESARKQTHQEMAKSITQLINQVSDEESKKLAIDELDRQIIDAFRFDSNIDQFVNQQIKIDKMDYRDEIQRVFVRGCVPKQAIVAYQQERLFQLQKTIIDQRAAAAFDELDSL